MKKPVNQDNVSGPKEFKTSSDILLKPFYGDSQKPGDFPYTRGPYATMYRTKPWTMRQYSGFGSASETNRRFHYLLEHGQTGLSCAFDLPTQMGYDSDSPMAQGEVGKVGVAISHIDDMDILLKKIPLEKVSTSMTINSTAGILLSLYISIAKRRGLDISLLRGTIQNDILKEYIARGTYIYPPEFSLKLIAEIFRFSHRIVPHWNPISISGYHIREAGSTAAQEIAFTLENAFTYVETALKAGLQLEQFVPRLSFFFNVHNHFFEEIAKFRVARKIYAEEMVKRFGADPKTVALRFHAQTAGSSLTAQQPLNNAIRVAYQAMAAALGGAQSLHTNSFDEALSLPTEQSALLALRTQQILAEETGIVPVADPMAGAYFLEDLSRSLEEKSRTIMTQVQEHGGVVAAIRKGFIQGEIQKAAFVAQQEIDSGRQKVVGVNCHQSEEKPWKDIQKLDQKIARDQLKRLSQFKKSRSQKKLSAVLKTLEAEVVRLQKDGHSEVMERIQEACESKASLGEISDVLRGVAGTYD